MARAPRNNEPGTWHHITNQGVDKRDVFLGDTDRLTIERLFGQLCEEHHVGIHAYCLMGNHYHLLGRADGDGGISPGMQQLSSSYTRIVNERVGRVGPIFCGRFNSVTIESDEQLLATVAYIHRNPVDLVPIAAVPAYRWSSYGVYLGRRPAPHWLTTSFIEGLLTPHEHRSLVMDGIIASAAISVPPNVIADALARIAPGGSDGQWTVALVASAGAGACTTEELMGRFGFATPAAARMALSRARGRCQRSAELAKLVATVEAIVGTRSVTRGV